MSSSNSDRSGRVVFNRQIDQGGEEERIDWFNIRKEYLSTLAI
jgi:hypothetical protein